MSDAMLTRRGLLQAAAPVLLDAASQDNETVRENRKPGTVEWQLRHYSLDSAGGSGLRCPRLEGFCSETSVYPNQKIQFLVSANPARSFQIDIYRTGYYGGLGGLHMTRLGPIHGEPQPTPLMGNERIRECAWHPATEFTIPADWPGGVYLGKLSLVDEPVESYVIFVVKSRRPFGLAVPVLGFHLAGLQQVARLGLLYDDGISNRTNGFTYTGPDVRVSFDRPYASLRPGASGGTFARFGRVSAMGVSHGVLAREARVRCDVLRRTPTSRANRDARQLQGVPLGRPRRGTGRAACMNRSCARAIVACRSGFSAVTPSAALFEPCDSTVTGSRCGASRGSSISPTRKC